MNVRSLNGTWDARLPGGRAVRADVPGCIEQVTDLWADPGPVVYETAFTASGAPARLRFRGVSYFCEASLNGVPIGSHEGMWDAFVLDCGGAVHAGENRLALKVTKPGYRAGDAFPVRAVLSGFLPDVLTTFNGIWDDAELLEDDALFVHAHFCEGTPDGAGKAGATVEALIPGLLGYTLTVRDPSGAVVSEAEGAIAVEAGVQEAEFPFRLENPAPWAVGSPVLYSYSLELHLEGSRHTEEGRLGFRDVTTQGSQLLVSGLPVYPRGILHWGYDDARIIPSPGFGEARGELMLMREYGFNAVKHCLYVPRKAMLDAMDELGVFCWVELPLWLPEAGPELEARIRREYPRILRHLRGHPSVCMVSLGCELNDTVGPAVLSDMYDLAKRETGLPVRDNSGSGECYGGLNVEFADYYDYHFYAEPVHLGQLIGRFTPGYRTRMPWLFGEFADSDTLRDLQEVRRERGAETLAWERDDPERNPISLLKPDFFLGRHDAAMEESGLRRDYPEALALSLDHAMTHRKLQLETTRSFPEVGGYNVTSIRDVPIATSGMLDDLGRPKFPPLEFRKFNGDMVLVQAPCLSRIWVGADRVLYPERFNFPSGGVCFTRILLSNHSGKDVEGAALRWRLLLGEIPVLEREIPIERALPNAALAEAAALEITLPESMQPETLTLEVRLVRDGETLCENDWPLFTYPSPANTLLPRVFDPCGQFAPLLPALPGARPVRETEIPSLGNETLLACAFTDAIRRFVEGGGRAVVLQPSGGLLPTRPGPMWQEAMLRMFPHPILDGIRKETWYDSLRWLGMTADHSIDSKALEGIGARDVAPVLRRYDMRKWEASDYVCAFRLGDGLCAASTLRFGGGLGVSPGLASQNPLAFTLLKNMLRWLRQE